MTDEIAITRILYENPDAEPDAAKIAEVLNRAAQSGKKICVWPATADTIAFFKSISPVFFERCIFANIDPEHQWLRDTNAEFEFNVYTPDIIAKEAVEIVICPRMKHFESISAMCRENFPTVKAVIKVDELERLEKCL